MKKTFTIKKIGEQLRKVNNLNLAVVLPDGNLYIHCHGQAMLQSVYNNREKYCDVTAYIEEYIYGSFNKRYIARIIKEHAELFYLEREVHKNEF